MQTARFAGKQLLMIVFAACCFFFFGGRPAQGQDEDPQTSTGGSQSPDVKAAVERGLAALERSAAVYPQHRTCFSCHHQTLPMLAQVTAQASGFAIAADQVQAQLDLTVKSFERRVDEMPRGEGVGGRGMTVGYGLWAVILGEGNPGPTTEAMVAYLLKTQRDEGHWTGQMCRPPLEESYQTCTVLAVQGIRKHASQSQRADAEAAIAKAKAWLIAAPAKSQEDKVARLWGLSLVEAATDQIAAARTTAIKSQRSDGGWAQLDEMQSDAYATGQTLFVLQTTGLDSADAAYERGVQFLVKTQRDDGNWRVETRSKPVQPYFDYDDLDPLGHDQFISAAATGWAVAALAVAARQPTAPLERKEAGK